MTVLVFRPKGTQNCVCNSVYMSQFLQVVLLLFLFLDLLMNHHTLLCVLCANMSK